jgi:UDP-3-O-[3-hydroxymyristoyl] glucosamine N-acyltransferase
MSMLLKDLVERFGGVIDGDDAIQVTAIAPLTTASEGELSFLTNSRYRKDLAKTGASVVIVRAVDRESCTGTAWIVDDPYSTYARVAQLLYPPPTFTPGIHPQAIIDASASIAADSWVGPYCVIGADVRIDAGVYIGPACIIEAGCHIGARSRLDSRVVLGPETRIGQRGLIHPGAVLGSDGFGFANDHGVWVKIPQIGRVIIGDDVEIGCNTTIDRGALGDTEIGDGVKLDNQIQVGHNVRIGAHTAIAACTGIAGSAVIGQRCAIGGYVGINGHLTIVDDVQITGRSFITGSIDKPGVYSSGYPHEPNRQWRRNAVRLHQLDAMARRLAKLEKKIGSDGQ